MDRVGILGGTFDPIHLGHLIVGEAARERLGLDRLIFMPAGSPRLKEQAPSASPQQRLKMAQLAVDDNPCFEVGSHEVERPGLTYTVDTVEELRGGLEDDANLYFIVGMDALEQFDRWKEPERLLDLCSLVVVNRVGHQRVDVNDFVGRYPAGWPRSDPAQRSPCGNQLHRHPPPGQRKTVHQVSNPRAGRGIYSE